MKLIDDKGRLFGKINIVDFLIIFLICIIIPVFFYTYKVLGKVPRIIPSTWVKVEVVTFIIPEIEGIIKEGDTAYDIIDNPNGKILTIYKEDVEVSQKIQSAMIRFAKMKDRKVPSHVGKILMRAELELLCSKSAENEPWYYNRSPLHVSLDRPFTFSTQTYNITFFATKIISEQPKNKWVTK